MKPAWLNKFNVDKITDWGLAGIFKELIKVRKLLRWEEIYGQLKRIYVILQVTGMEWRRVQMGESFKPSLKEYEQGSKVCPKRRRDNCILLFIIILRLTYYAC